MLQVFLRSISARLALGAVAFLAAFAVLFLNMRLAQGALRSARSPYSARRVRAPLPWTCGASASFSSLARPSSPP